MLRIETDIPISVNHLYKPVVRKRHDTDGVVRSFVTMQLSAEGKVWKEFVGWQTRDAVTAQEWNPAPDAWFGYLILITFPNNRSDLDNALKVTQDAVFSALHVDDRRVIQILAGKQFGDPRAEIAIFTKTLEEVASEFRPFLETQRSVAGANNVHYLPTITRNQRSDHAV